MIFFVYKVEKVLKNDDKQKQPPVPIETPPSAATGQENASLVAKLQSEISKETPPQGTTGEGGEVREKRKYTKRGTAGADTVPLTPPVPTVWNIFFYFYTDPA